MNYVLSQSILDGGSPDNGRPIHHFGVGEIEREWAMRLEASCRGWDYYSLVIGANGRGTRIAVQYGPRK